MRTHRLALLAAAVLLGACTSSGSDDGSSTSDTTEASSAEDTASSERLFVQLAESAVVSSADGGQVLELEGVDPATISFTDRPARRAGTQSTARVVAAIAGTDDPPNAALVWTDEGGEQTVVVELSGGTYDEEASTLTYEVRALAEGESEMDGFDGGAELPSEPVGPASLYIDSLNTSLTCKVDFVNDTSTDLRLGDVKVLPTNTIVTAPVDLEGYDGYPIEVSGDGAWDAELLENVVTFTGGNWDPSQGDLNILAAGETSEIYEFKPFDSAVDGCLGSVEIANPAATPSNPLPVIARYNFDDPAVAADDHGIDCESGFVCTIHTHSMDDTLYDTVTICDGDVCP